MRQETLTYEADGLTMRSEIFLPDGDGARPGVLVFPEAFGLSEHELGRAKRLAEMGYVALASDLLGDRRREENVERAVGLLKPLFEDPRRTRARARAGLDALLAHGADPKRVAAIGFCFGGTMALELARDGAALAAVVGFHSGLGSTMRAEKGAIGGKVLVCIGADDPMIDAEARAAFEAEMKAAGADWEITVYGNTVHGFTNPAADGRGKPEAIRYSADADRRSWGAMRALFAETIAA